MLVVKALRIVGVFSVCAAALSIAAGNFRDTPGCVFGAVLTFLLADAIVIDRRNATVENDEQKPLNVAVRLGNTHISQMAHPEVVGGIIRFGGKQYRIDENHHPVEVCPQCGEDGYHDSGDCMCNTQVSRCCP